MVWLDGKALVARLPQRRLLLGAPPYEAMPALRRWFSIRHVLFVAFTLIAVVPVIALAGWVENRAVRQETDAAWDLSHELRTPLNAILGVSQVMRDEPFGARSRGRLMPRRESSR